MTGFANGSGADLAADIGGTHARIARVEERSGELVLVDHRKYRCAEFSGLTEIVEHYCDDIACGSPSQLSAAVAGAISGNGVIASNMPWDYGFDRLKARYPGIVLHALNDYHAVAVGTQYLGKHDYTLLAGARPINDGLAIAMGVGTGFGAAIRWGTGPSLRVLPTELGQTRLGAHHALELDVLGLLADENGFVRMERVLSGPGIAATYDAVRQVLRLHPLKLPPSDVVARADAGEEAAVAAIRLVVGVLANLIGDLAVMLDPRGGIFLSGGVTPKLHRFLRAPTFGQALQVNQPMRGRILDIPVMLVASDDIGILGAAHWTRHQRAYQNG